VDTTGYMSIDRNDVLDLGGVRIGSYTPGAVFGDGVITAGGSTIHFTGLEPVFKDNVVHFTPGDSARYETVLVWAEEDGRVIARAPSGEEHLLLADLDRSRVARSGSPRPSSRSSSKSSPAWNWEISASRDGWLTQRSS